MTGTAYVNLFGEPIADAKLAVLQGPKPKRKATKPRGYAWAPGTGPAGETCSSCKHIARHRSANTYLKCGLVRAKWTHGPGTDIRARSPACKLWESAA